jgi:hypothetical protein
LCLANHPTRLYSPNAKELIDDSVNKIRIQHNQRAIVAGRDYTLLDF